MLKEVRSCLTYFLCLCAKRHDLQATESIRFLKHLRGKDAASVLLIRAKVVVSHINYLLLP